MNSPADQRRFWKRLFRRFHSFSLRTALLLLLLSVCIMLVAAAQVLGMSFQPGWANGWPGDSKHSAFATAIAGLTSVVALAAGAVGIALPCHYMERRVKRAYIGWAVFALLMTTWARQGLVVR